MKARVKDIAALLEKHYPLNLAEKWDNVGLQVGSAGREAEKVVVALDLDHQVLEQAQKEKADLIITHHPLIFKPLSNIQLDGPTGSLIRKLVLNDISLYAAHTNLDSAERGVNQLLAERLGLTGIEPLSLSGTGMQEDLYKLVVYVPAADTEIVRAAINNAGAGYIGNYSDCSFRTAGWGTFKPAAGANPYIGEPGQLEEVEEYRLETICPGHSLKAVLSAMWEAHPYEEVAYDLYRLENHGIRYSPGRKGMLEQKINLGRLAEQVSRQLSLSTVRLVGDVDRMVQKAAVISGSGASFIKEVAGQSEVLITGDLKYHEARDAAALGLAVIDAGHQATEELIVPELCRLLQEGCTQAGWQIKFIPVKISPPWIDLPR